jgi:hypothetical protein
MLAGKPLFPPNLERELHIALMIVSFGDFPADLIRRGKYSSEFFTKGTYHDILDAPAHPSNSKLTFWYLQQANFSRTSQSDCCLLIM